MYLPYICQVEARRDVQRGAELGRKLRRGLEAERRGRGEMVAEIERTAELQVQLARERDELHAQARLQRDRCEGGAVRASRVRELEAALGAAQAEAAQALKDGRTERQRAHSAQAALRELQQWRSGMAT